jgi:dCMP deaminase
MHIAELFGERSSCPRADVGAVAVRDGRIVASGYVGAPSGQPHCDEVGCDIEMGHCVRTIHAEANLVAWAARVGTSLEGTTVYCTHSPCRRCAQLLLNAGIDEYRFKYEYDDTWLWLKQSGVTVTRDGMGIIES